jgi:hypothetical protein
MLLIAASPLTRAACSMECPATSPSPSTFMDAYSHNGQPDASLEIIDRAPRRISQGRPVYVRGRIHRVLMCGALRKVMQFTR